MKPSTFSYGLDNRRSADEFPDCDAEQTLVIVPAAPEYMDQPSSILPEPAEACPRPELIGCPAFSFHGEIPQHAGDACGLHKQSMTLTAFSEA
jgi:hypothetical protein